MNYLLKIVQGAQAGAEIALAEGVVTFGSSDACDIVLADASLPAEAFAIETSAAGVSLKELPDGEAKKLDLYTLFTFGNTSFAVGENGVAWPEVKAPAPPPPPEPPAGETEEEAPAPPPPPPPAEENPRPASNGRGFGCLVVLVLVLLFFAGGYFLALRYGSFWKPRKGVAAPQAETAQREEAAPARQGDSARKGDEAAAPAGPLGDWAAEYGVSVSEKDGKTVLSGNFAKKADRERFKADAYARDADLVLDLSDDETLKSGVEEVLSSLCEGRITLEKATNRVVKLAGRVRSREELLQTVATICTDVNRVRVVDDTAVVCDDGKRTSAPTRYQALSPQSVRKQPFVTPPAKPGAPALKSPVAGIILMPYPCLVLRDGTRAAEGAMVGEFKVEKIEADKVTLKHGEETVTWKP